MIRMSARALSFAAAALHGTNPEGRWPRVAGRLEPGGVFASFSGQILLADPVIEAAVAAANRPFLDSHHIPSPDGTPPGEFMQWPGTELRNSEYFDDVQQHVIERRYPMTAADYIVHLSTVSAYAHRPERDRDQVFGQIARVLPATVDIVGDIWLHLARRRP